MAPAGAVMVSYTRVTPRATLFEAITQSLSPEQDVLLTHLVAWLLALISGIFLGLRFFAIWYKKFVLVVDDGILAASWIVVLFFSIITSISLALGTGTASSDASSTATSPSAPLLLDNVTRTAAITASAWSKTAFAFGLLGLSQRRSVRWALLAVVANVNLIAVAGIIVQWVRCQPVFKAWVVGTDGSCFARGTTNAVGIGVQAFFALFDILLVVLGYMLVWSKDLVLSERVGVVFLGILGLLASTAAVLTAVEISTLEDANFAASNIRPLLASSIEPPLIIIAASLPALRLLLSSVSSTPLRNRIRSMHPPRRQSSLLTPLEPSSPLGLRPARPLRPMSSRSFMTTSTKADNLKRGGPTGSSNENLVKGLDYNYNYWNPAIPPTVNAVAAPASAGSGVGGGGGGIYQQHQQQNHTPTLSRSSTLQSGSDVPLAIPYSSLAAHDTPEANSTSPYPARNNSARGIRTPNQQTPTKNNTTTNNNYSSYNTRGGTANSTSPAPPNNSYNWHSTNPNPTTAASPPQPTNRRLTTLEEEARTNASPSWSSNYTSILGLTRDSTRRESPTLGTWSNTRPGVEAPRDREWTSRQREVVDREREFEYDTPRRSRSYFSRLQALSGYTVGNPFTNRL